MMPASPWLLRRNRTYETSKRRPETEPKHFTPACTSAQSGNVLSGTWALDDDPSQGEGNPSTGGKNDHTGQAGYASCPAAGAGLSPEGSDREESVHHYCSKVLRS